MHIHFEYCPICQAPMRQDSGAYNKCTSDSCTYEQYKNPTPVVAAVVEYGERQVILGHNRAWPPTWFGLITGFLEEHEHPDECIVREVKEELGLNVEIQSFIGHYTFKRLNQIIIAYHVKCDKQPIILDDELDEYRIVPFDTVKYWPAGTGYALRDLLVSMGYDPEERPFK